MREKGWKELPIRGSVVEPGNSMQYKTGGWRAFRPIWTPDKCIHCLSCFIYCPEGAIIVRDGKVVGINYDHCKGCGICARECPPKAEAVTMINEVEAQQVTYDYETAFSE